MNLATVATSTSNPWATRPAPTWTASSVSRDPRSGGWGHCPNRSHRMTEITIMYVLLRRGAEYPRHTDCLGIYSTPERAMQAGDVSVANAMEVVYGAAERAGTKPTVVLPQVWETLYHAGTAPGGRYAR